MDIEAIGKELAKNVKTQKVTLLIKVDAKSAPRLWGAGGNSSILKL